MNNIEKKLIIEIYKFNPDVEKIEKIIKEEKIDWPSILGFVSYHRIAGLFYEKFNNINIRLLEYPVFFSTYMINQSQRLRYNIQLEEIKNISKAFIENNIKHVFLKGTILNQIIFQPGCRASNDIDILIDKDSIEKATQVLNDIGFIQGKYNYKKNIIEKYNDKELQESITKRGETCPFIKTTNQLTLRTVDVDLNFSLDWTPDYNNNIIKNVLDNRIALKLDDDNIIYSANIYHNLIELCTHLYKDMALLDIVSKRKVFDLYKIIDIYYYIMKFYNDIDFSVFEEEINKTDSNECVYFALKHIVSLFIDLNKQEIITLLNKLEHKISNKEILNTIFNQYNHNEKYISNSKIIDRFFTYDVINLYKPNK